jgi:hypothetical protein
MRLILLKAKAVPNGTIKEYSGRKYQKTATGWKYVGKAGQKAKTGSDKKEQGTTKNISTQQAREMGRKAFKEGKMAIPARDYDLMEQIKGKKVGSSSAGMMKEWLAGWTEANLASKELSFDEQIKPWEEKKEHFRNIANDTGETEDNKKHAWERVEYYQSKIDELAEKKSLSQREIEAVKKAKENFHEYVKEMGVEKAKEIMLGPEGTQYVKAREYISNYQATPQIGVPAAGDIQKPKEKKLVIKKTGEDERERQRKMLNDRIESARKFYMEIPARRKKQGLKVFENARRELEKFERKMKYEDLNLKLAKDIFHKYGLEVTKVTGTAIRGWTHSSGNSYEIDKYNPKRIGFHGISTDRFNSIVNDLRGSGFSVKELTPPSKVMGGGGYGSIELGEFNSENRDINNLTPAPIEQPKLVVKTESKKESKKTDYSQYANDDYQKRGDSDRVPRSNIPDYIDAGEGSMAFTFKSTSEKSAEAWVRSYIKQKGLDKLTNIYTQQTGDYNDDWVQVYAEEAKPGKETPIFKLHDSDPKVGDIIEFEHGPLANTKIKIKRDKKAMDYHTGEWYDYSKMGSEIRFYKKFAKEENK